MKIAIVIPSHDMVHTDFAMCLTRLIAYTVSVGHVEPVIINPRSSLVQKGRWIGVKQALHLPGIDKVLFIDSDQTFPANALHKLMHWNKKVACATYRLRQDELEYTARNTKGDRIDFSQRTGLHEVASTGLGFALINASVFQEIPEPWFTVDYIDGTWVSEDESFFQQVKHKVWVDADLTKQIGHVGIKEYI